MTQTKADELQAKYETAMRSTCYEIEVAEVFLRAISALREAQAEIERLRVDYASALKSHAALRHHRAESRLGEQVVPVGELPVNAVKMKMQADAWLAVYDEVEPELAQDSGLGTGVDAVIRVIRRLRSLTPQAAHPER